MGELHWPGGGAMRVVRTLVDRPDGRSEPADQIACPECEGSTFRFFVVRGHIHLQCSNCESYTCQGGCAEGAAHG